LKADFASQMDFNNLVKTGFEFVYNDIHFDYGTIAYYYLDRWGEHVVFDAKPIRAAVYLQDKLETKGFIMNLGLRLDYSNSNTDWYDPYIYDEDFFTSKYNVDMIFPIVDPKPQWQLSPRLGISHPVTENSKLFFNYGHFKQMPSYETLFRIGRASDQRLSLFGDPNLILAKTISYELGYDHSLFDDYLFQIAAFYHDIFDQQNTTHYASVGGIQYDRTTSNSYEDIRGFEVSIQKNRGRWWSFFGNYTYQVTTRGHFDREYIYEDLTRQKEYDEATVNLYQDRPIPRPYARFNLSVYTPDDFGPVWAKIHPLGDFTANLLLNWQAGNWVDYNPKGLVTVRNNVQQPDYFDVTLRFGKAVHIGKLKIYAFVDVQNLLNIRRMSLNNFGGKANDQQLYRESLHLPKSKAYDNIPGNDRIGDYRKEGVPYQPVFWRGQINYSSPDDIGIEGAIYYDKATGRYVEYVDGAWSDVPSRRMYQILKDKAYIDMPNMSSFTFFNPRQFFFGIRFSYDLQ
jgi:outer membrane receptor protein involved in Fe transport